MRPAILFATLCCLAMLFSCKQPKNRIDYYIFSKIEAEQKVHDDSIRDYHLPPPPPPIEPKWRWYSNLVMIFDTANKVYLYQTENYPQRNIIKQECSYGYCDFYETNLRYPNFLGLQPEHLLTIDASYLLDFLKDNDTFFRLDTNYRKTNRFLYLVSDFDTIRNDGFYKLKKVINSSKHMKKGFIFYKIRRATEEERNVLSCRRTGKPYNPGDILWSTKFLDGNTRPFTARYDSLEKHCCLIIKAKEILPENVMKFKYRLEE